MWKYQTYHSLWPSEVALTIDELEGKSDSRQETGKGHTGRSAV